MNIQIDSHWTNYYNQGKDFGLITSQALTKMLSYTEADTVKRCLDIGCGTGQLTRELFHRGYKCVGIDISSKAIDDARSYTKTPLLHYLHFDIENDDISSLILQPYSLITCKLVYAFIKNKVQFLDTIQSILLPGATFVVITPTYKDPREDTPIAVNYEKTLELLKSRFKAVSTFELKDSLTYYICS